ncbi:hypothetical protein COLO4_31837 [Corchorus olitorius]|uniref:Uncharacterized protein n=1 Tax=Corchorus olitorius TaxID=93759 RepID=A0A1R3H388_9ROSI|nr:hypothetical protein COLO4_31837 [Corchorus olitorius]
MALQQRAAPGLRTEKCSSTFLVSQVAGGSLSVRFSSELFKLSRDFEHTGRYFRFQLG